MSTTAIVFVVLGAVLFAAIAGFVVLGFYAIKRIFDEEM